MAGLGYSPVKTALTMLPATVGIVAGNGLGMPIAPRLGRRLPMIGLALLLAGAASMAVLVSGQGAELTPWHLAVPILLYGAGLGLGASSLMLITLTGAGTADAGTASGLVNTVVQLGMAAGPATVGTAFFGSLSAGGDYASATRTALLIGLALFAVALAACLLLPAPAAERADLSPAAGE